MFNESYLNSYEQGSERTRFEVNPSTGEIKAIGDFDYEVGSKEFNLVIIAIDNKGKYPYNDNQTVVKITLLDVNDEPPEIIVSLVKIILAFQSGHFLL